MRKLNLLTGDPGVGGFLLTPESIATPDAPKKMIGSTFIVEATSIDEVQKLVEGDIYYKSGVVSRTYTSRNGLYLSNSWKWDVERIVILPFVAATKIP